MDSMGLEINNARPNLARSWGGLSEDARREFKGVQRDIPPLARDAAQGANREVQNAQPTWGQSWADRYRSAHGHTSAIRRDVPPIVGGRVGP